MLGCSSIEKFRLSEPFWPAYAAHILARFRRRRIGRRGGGGERERGGRGRGGRRGGEGGGRGEDEEKEGREEDEQRPERMPRLADTCRLVVNRWPSSTAYVVSDVFRKPLLISRSCCTSFYPRRPSEQVVTDVCPSPPGTCLGFHCAFFNLLLYR